MLVVRIIDEDNHLFAKLGIDSIDQIILQGDIPEAIELIRSEETLKFAHRSSPPAETRENWNARRLGLPKIESVDEWIEAVVIREEAAWNLQLAIRWFFHVWANDTNSSDYKYWYDIISGWRWEQKASYRPGKIYQFPRAWLRLDWCFWKRTFVGIKWLFRKWFL